MAKLFMLLILQADRLELSRSVRADRDRHDRMLYIRKCETIVRA